MSNVLIRLREVILARRAQRQRIEYLYRSFPQELTVILEQLDIDEAGLSKDEMLQVLETEYRKGIPGVQRMLFNPTYVQLLNVCRRRLRLRKVTGMFDLEQQIWQEIQQRQTKGKRLGLRPNILGRFFRYDPGALIQLLPLIHPLHQNIRGRVVIGVVGSPSAGKDAALKAIFGIETGNIMPIAGSTKDIEIYEYQQRHDVLVVNTPGMGDVSTTVTQRAVEVLSNIDVYLYLLNSEGGLQAREYDDLQACIQTGKDVIVVLNKIDLIREHKREEFIQSVRSQLPETIVVVPSCLDPIPGLMEPMGIDEVRHWLAGVTERYVTSLGLTDAGRSLNALFMEPCPTPKPQDRKVVEVTPLPGHQAIDIQQMYEKPNDILRQHPILTTIAGIWLFSIFVTPFLVLAAIIWLVYSLVSGVIDVTLFAHEKVVETHEAVQQSLEIPVVTLSDVQEDIQRRRITAQVDVNGLNVESTSLLLEWFVIPKGKPAKPIEQGTMRLEDVTLPATLTLSRSKVKGQVKHGDEVFLKVTPKNQVGQAGTPTKSKRITIANQPLAGVTVTLATSREGQPAQMGDSLICNADVQDFDGDAQLFYQWFDQDGVEIPDLATKTSVQTCRYPSVSTYTCRVTADDVESPKQVAEQSLTINPLTNTGKLLFFAVKPQLAELKEGKTGLDKTCESEARKAFKKGVYAAWLSNPETSPYLDMVRSAGPYVNTAGEVIARDWCQLTLEGIQKPITQLKGKRSDFHFFTRTNLDGQFDGSCKKLSSCGCPSKAKVRYGDGALTYPVTRDNPSKEGSWTSAALNERDACDDLFVVCVQQP